MRNLINIQNYPLIISLGYLVVVLLWVLISDQITHLINGNNVSHEFYILSIRDSLFVIISALLFYFILRQFYSKHQSSEEKYKNLVETSNQGLVQTDKDLNVTFVNTPFLKMTGLTEQEVVGQNFKTLIQKFLKESEKEKVFQGLEERENNIEGQNEFSYVGKNGSEFWYLVNTKPLTGKKGNFDGIISTLMDITSRKNIEKKLEESQLIFQALSEKSLIGIYMFQDFTFKYVNPHFCNIFGYSREELIENMGPLDLTHPEDHEKVKNYSYEKEEGTKEATKFEFRGITKAGNIIHVEAYGTWMIYQEHPTIIGTMVDITDRVQTKNELLRAKENAENNFLLYKTIFDASNDGIFIYASRDQVAYVNKAACNMHGMTEEELKSMNPKSFIDPETYQVFLEFIDTVERDEEFQGEASGLTREGSRFYVMVYGCPLHIKGKKYYFSIIKDITEIRKGKAELKEKNEALEKANQELDSFVYRVSHDLRAPIASSIGLAQLTNQSSDLEEIHKYAGLQIDALGKLDRFIQDILNYSRNSRMEIHPEEVDFDQVVENALSENPAESAEITPEIYKHISSPNGFKSDKLRLNIIFKNLISNAFKYLNPRVDNPFIEIDVKVKEDHADIIIGDNGLGIPPEYQDKIFDMFFRANEKQPGSGIGLYIVKDCIEKLDGKIDIDSNLGEGTKFKMQIPNLKDNR